MKLILVIAIIILNLTNMAFADDEDALDKIIYGNPFEQLLKTGTTPPPPVCFAGSQVNKTNGLPDFCENPFRYICEYDGLTTKDRSQNIDGLRAQVKRDALAATAKAFGIEPSQFSEDTIHNASFGKRVLMLFKYLSEAGHRIEERTKDIEAASVAFQAKNIHRILERAIQSAADRREITADQAARYLEQEKEIALFSLSELFEKNDSMLEPERESLLSAFKYQCGADGLNTNSFAIMANKKRVIVVCPGWVLGAAGAGTDRVSNFLNLLLVVTHEFSHHIDYGNFKDDYAKFESCLTKNFSDLLFITYTEQDKINASSMSQPAKAAAIAKQKVDQHMGEITADFWAVRALVEFMRNSNPPLSRENKLRIIRESFAGLCSSGQRNDGKPLDGYEGDDGTHPSVRFRMDVLLRRNPDIDEMLECLPPKNPKPGCTLKGETDFPIF